MQKQGDNVEALALALALSITAPSEELLLECVSMANQIAAGLSEFEVEQAKKKALVLAEEFKAGVE